MPMTNKTEATDSVALPGKMSLLTKESEGMQNPCNYFESVVKDYDTFATIYDEIIENRAKGKLLKYWGRSHKLLDAFLIVQDPRGVNWICPLDVTRDSIGQGIFPLDFLNGKEEYPQMLEKSFGSITISLEDYISACSRGFDNASRVLLGEEAVKLDIGYSLIAVYYFTNSK